jgi:ppGpp synthetase/RelA/SpoT-type nucleotidyltranferase
MSETKRPSLALLAAQIKDYEKERPHYQTYAEALQRVLETACQRQLPEAIVTARPKGVSSFAEKCVRRSEKYPDAVRQFTDLCGGRVIVQTKSQVEDVRHFVEQHFIVVETEDISLRLGGKEFGYRDRHYIVQLDPKQAAGIGFKPEEITAIGDRKAELQIRTWAQHAWADTLHDRTYKSPLKPTQEIERRAALLAALMEEGDHNFDHLANELDGLVDNYAAHHSRSEVQQEIDLNTLIHDHQQPDDQPPVALKLAKLHAALGQQAKAVALLEPHQEVALPLRAEIRLELGTALCRQHRSAPGSPAYQRGLALLDGVASLLAKPEASAVNNRQRRTRLRARVLSRLGWAWEVSPKQKAKAGPFHREAHELQPDNPYYLSNMLGFELASGVNRTDVVRCLRPDLLAAVRACETHTAQSMELPFAFFTAGRLRLLLGETDRSFHDYLRGAHHCPDEQSCVGCELLDDEMAWLDRVCPREEPPPAFALATSFLQLAKLARDCAHCGPAGKPMLPAPRAKLTAPVLIIAGGAASIAPEVLAQLRQPLTDALRGFTGTVISGGTTAGVPGLVGQIAGQLRESGGRGFHLVGYQPETLPPGAVNDTRYDEHVAAGKHDFTAEQILANWSDILAADISPKDVRLLGIGGGAVAAIEYRMALAMRAQVGLLTLDKAPTAPRDAADALVADPQWQTFPNLLPLPFDAATLRAFLNHRPSRLSPTQVESMARDLHRGYVENSQGKLPENLRPWDKLPEGYQRSNRAQAAYAVEILRAAGFGVREITGAADGIPSFAGKEFEPAVEQMAELEHGRWNIERLKEGWRSGKARDNDRKLNPCITPWSDDRALKGYKDYDRQAVRLFPKLLKEAGLEIYKLP